MNKKFWNEDRVELTFDLFMVGVWSALLLHDAIQMFLKNDWKLLAWCGICIFFIVSDWKRFWRTYDRIKDGRLDDPRS